jgi:hypothetical protein
MICGPDEYSVMTDLTLCTANGAMGTWFTGAAQSARFGLAHNRGGSIGTDDAALSIKILGL